MTIQKKKFLKKQLRNGGIFNGPHPLVERKSIEAFFDISVTEICDY